MPTSERVFPPRRGVGTCGSPEVAAKLKDTGQTQAVVLDWCYGFYNHDRRYGSAGMMSPIN